ncbi:MunI family type II restriction endonuclease [Lacticaseibacillus sp. 53-4]|uniref:MunI family type II restriction endonuclease n=1 Tax=Lacticaseibacillus sp. 53-4 TaxID=2799575 RepID=UPI001943FF0F|nr:MunI family type II restriction endonuclease [Lacticaseibacillus sp. 53-4]
MASSNLRLRGNWQTNSGAKAKNTEYTLTEVLRQILPSDVYQVNEQIRDFKNVYSDLKLPEDIEDKIYDPGPTVISNVHWGWVPDNSIENKFTHKKIFIELKRQDGWVEGKTPSAGRGNAHERGLKHFSPGILDTEKSASGITDGFLPFLLIYVGDITRDPRRNREIYFWFQGHEQNHYMWIANGQGVLSVDDLKDFLYTNILPHLD